MGSRTYTRMVEVTDIAPGTSYTLQPGEATTCYGTLVVQHDGRFERWVQDWRKLWWCIETCHGAAFTLTRDPLPVVQERPEPVLDQMAWRDAQDDKLNHYYREDRDFSKRPI